MFSPRRSSAPPSSALSPWLNARPGRRKRPMKSVLAGKKFTPPISGQADVDYIRLRPSEKARPRHQDSGEEHLERADPAADDRRNLVRQEPKHDSRRQRCCQRPAAAGRSPNPRNPNAGQPEHGTSMLQFSHANGTVKAARGEVDGCAGQRTREDDPRRLLLRKSRAMGDGHRSILFEGDVADSSPE